ncbi:MAG: GIY-YIG nuclease family protein [Halomonas sp. BM-2019]|nr:MAG: GIY-YIG nuclease family protein [Halomonas sp. BM-2019]
MLETAAGALYTGITTDVDRRLAEHAAGRGAKALRLEAEIKRLSPRAKRAWLARRALSAASSAGG